MARPRSRSKYRAMLVIENAASDPVHGQNPLVKDMPFLRFYAGAPFTAPDGRVLGAVAVIDTEPRFRFSEGDREALDCPRDLLRRRGLVRTLIGDQEATISDQEPSTTCWRLWVGSAVPCQRLTEPPQLHGLSQVLGRHIQRGVALGHQGRQHITTQQRRIGPPTRIGF